MHVIVLTNLDSDWNYNGGNVDGAASGTVNGCTRFHHKLLDGERKAGTYVNNFYMT